LVVLAGVIIVVGTLVFRSAGAWLVLNDDLEPARAIVVLGGQMPFRAKEAAVVYKQGWAHEVWLTRGGTSDEDKALRELALERPPEYVYSRQVLERSGVPSDAIRVLDGPTPDTAAEVRAIARELGTVGGDAVIIVTSKYHTRRVRFLWHSLVGNHPRAIVRYTTTDLSEPRRWWRTSDEGLNVLREWVGLLNAGIGFPLKNGRS